MYDLFVLGYSGISTEIVNISLRLLTHCGLVTYFYQPVYLWLTSKTSFKYDLLTKINAAIFLTILWHVVYKNIVLNHSLILTLWGESGLNCGFVEGLCSCHKHSERHCVYLNCYELGRLFDNLLIQPRRQTCLQRFWQWPLKTMEKPLFYCCLPISPCKRGVANLYLDHSIIQSTKADNWKYSRCHYNLVQYCQLLHNQLQELRQNINHMLDPQKTPHTST